MMVGDRFFESFIDIVELTRTWYIYLKPKNTFYTFENKNVIFMHADTYKAK